jgi:threonine dehydrogenase-like Zn-dependent dehydrogenase
VRALTVAAGWAGSGQLTEIPEPPVLAGLILVTGVALGVCGTELEIVNGEYGRPPPGRNRLVLGHESIGRLRDVPAPR